MTTRAGARGAALEILRAVRDGTPFDHALDHAIADLAEPDRKLAHAIAAGVLRERRRLDERITVALRRSGRRISEDLVDVLRIGTYQIASLDRVPDYAAVQSAVELAKMACGSQAAPLVNAVLRRIAREAGKRGGPRPHAAVTSLAASHSHPDWLVDRWVRHFGESRTERLLRHNNTRPQAVLQPVRWTLERLRESLMAAGIEAVELPGREGLAVPGRRIPSLPGYAEGGFIVQDPSQRRLLGFAAIPHGGTVWDACAAPGGKAILLAGQGTVIATDWSRERSCRLRNNARRTGRALRIVTADARKPPWRASSFSYVLVDAPCSATGTMSRHPDARWRLSARRIERQVHRQREILDGAAPVVRRGGWLTYLTCSLEPEENGHQIDAFLQRHPEFERDGDDMFIFPPDSNTGGGFASRMRRIA